MISKHSIVISGHRTSVSLEDAFWDALKIIAAHRSVSINHVVQDVDLERGSNLSSALRVFILRYFRDASSFDLRAEPDLGRHSAPVSASYSATARS